MFPWFPFTDRDARDVAGVASARQRGWARLSNRASAAILGQFIPRTTDGLLWLRQPMGRDTARVFVTVWPLELVIVWLALSGGAMLLERINPQPVIIEQPDQSSNRR